MGNYLALPFFVRTFAREKKVFSYFISTCVSRNNSLLQNGHKGCLNIFMKTILCPQCGKPMAKIGSKKEEGAGRCMNVYTCSNPKCRNVWFNDPSM